MRLQDALPYTGAGLAGAPAAASLYQGPHALAQPHPSLDVLGASKELSLGHFKPQKGRSPPPWVTEALPPPQPGHRLLHRLAGDRSRDHGSQANAAHSRPQTHPVTSQIQTPSAALKEEFLTEGPLLPVERNLHTVR